MEISEILLVSEVRDPFPLRDCDFNVATIGCMVLRETIHTGVSNCDVANKWVRYPF